jgi:hypothetical protein
LDDVDQFIISEIVRRNGAYLNSRHAGESFSNEFKSRFPHEDVLSRVSILESTGDIYRSTVGKDQLLSASTFWQSALAVRAPTAEPLKRRNRTEMRFESDQARQLMRIWFAEWLQDGQAHESCEPIGVFVCHETGFDLHVFESSDATRNAARLLRCSRRLQKFVVASFSRFGTPGHRVRDVFGAIVWGAKAIGMVPRS